MQADDHPQHASEIDHERVVAELAEAAQGASTQIASSFSETLRKIVQRVVGEGPQADQALADGGFVLKDTTVVLRLNPQTNFVEFFSDIGEPDTHSLESTYRAALEANLCRTFPGVTLGVHPQSGRLVATLAMNGLMAQDEDFCMTLLETLTERATQIRQSGLFRFMD